MRVTRDGRCHECGAELVTSDDARDQPPFLSLPQMRYQNAYVWLIFVSVLDLLLTMFVLYLWGGYEVNPIAAAVIDHMGFLWAIVFKFGLIVLVIIICEVLGRRHDPTGRRLATVAVVISALPVAYTFLLLSHTSPMPVN